MLIFHHPINQDLAARWQPVRHSAAVRLSVRQSLFQYGSVPLSAGCMCDPQVPNCEDGLLMQCPLTIALAPNTFKDVHTLATWQFGRGSRKQSP